MREERNPTELRRIADAARRIYLQLEETALNMEKTATPTVLIHIGYIDNTINRCVAAAERINIEAREQIDARAAGIRSHALKQKMKAQKQRIDEIEQKSTGGSVKRPRR